MAFHSSAISWMKTLCKWFGEDIWRIDNSNNMNHGFTGWRTGHPNVWCRQLGFDRHWPFAVQPDHQHEFCLDHSGEIQAHTGWFQMSSGIGSHQFSVVIFCQTKECDWRILFMSISQGLIDSVNCIRVNGFDSVTIWFNHNGSDWQVNGCWLHGTNRFIRCFLLCDARLHCGICCKPIRSTGMLSHSSRRRIRWEHVESWWSRFLGCPCDDAVLVGSNFRDWEWLISLWGRSGGMSSRTLVVWLWIKASIGLRVLMETFLESKLDWWALELVQTICFAAMPFLVIVEHRASLTGKSMCDCIMLFLNHQARVVRFLASRFQQFLFI